MPRPKSSGLPKAEEERLRLTQLLDVAAEIFFEIGYEAASTAEIAARAHSQSGRCIRASPVKRSSSWRSSTTGQQKSPTG